MVQENSGRGVTAEERGLWQKVAATCEPSRGPVQDKAAPRGRQGRLLTADERDAWQEATALLDGVDGKPAGDGSRSCRSRGDRGGEHAGRTTARQPARKLHGGAWSWRSTGTSGLEPGISRKIRQGKLDPERVIDLHGYRKQQACVAVESFLEGACRSGARLVLIVTGKGRRSRDMDTDSVPARVGVLRDLVRDMLGGPALSRLVVGFQAAHSRHGGSGAFYVHLRRARKSRNGAARNGRRPAGSDRPRILHRQRSRTHSYHRQD